jgi:hypothetical protein
MQMQSSEKSPESQRETRKEETEMHQRFPKMRLVPQRTEWAPNAMLRGLKALPVLLR